MRKLKMMTRLLAFMLALIWIASVSAQSNMDIAEARIEAERNNPTNQLDLSSLELESLPESLWELTDLQILNIRNNHISSLSPEMANMQHFTTLFADHNAFTEFPMVLTGMSSIIFIDLSYNQIANFPVEIKNLVNIQYLYLDENQITEIPIEITEMPLVATDIQIITLVNNPVWDDFPREIKTGSTWDLFVYLNPDIATDPSRQPNYQNARQMILDAVDAGGSHAYRLNFGEFGLTVLPPEIGQLGELLYELDLRGNQLSDLPPELSQLTNLHTLYLSRNAFTEFPEAILELTNLEILDLRENSISSLPDLSSLSQLEELYLGKNQLSSISNEISGLRSIETLDFHENRISSFTADLSGLDSLTTLDLRDNQLTEIPVALASSSSLLSACPHFPNYPPYMSCDGFVGTLTLDGNPLDWLPDAYRDLPIEEMIPRLFMSLDPALAESLGDEYSSEGEYADEIEFVRNGSSDRLDFYSINVIPDSVFSLTNLKELHIYDSFMTSLPPEIGQLSDLELLHIANTPLASLPPEIGQLQNLQSITIYGAAITELPDEFTELAKLETLYIVSSQLQALPEDFGQLSALRSLNISRNPIAELPVSISYLYNLVVSCSNVGGYCTGGLHRWSAV
jgi:Leucine-rich repeat (LRR) protein